MNRISKKIRIISFLFLVLTAGAVAYLFLPDIYRIISFDRPAQSIHIPYSADAEKILTLKSPRVMIALVIGQSNAANYGEKLYIPAEKVYSYYRGQLTSARDPLNGASGNGGSVWGILGDSLIKQGHYDAVVLVSIAIGSTSISCWSEGRCSVILKETLEELKRNDIKLTHVFWHQGEEDNHDNTPAMLYRSELKRILGVIRKSGQDAPFFVSLASYNPWAKGKPGYIGAEIRKAQMEFIKQNSDVFFGPDTDTISSSEDRYDGIHFSESGMRKYSRLWLNEIVNPRE